MATQLELTTDQFGIDQGLAHSIVHGDALTVVQTDGGPISSLAKTIAEALAAANAIVAPATQAAQDAQSAAELAETGAVAAQGGAQVSETAAIAARAGAELAETGAVAARAGAELAETGAVAAQGGAELARDEAEALVTPAVTDMGAGLQIDLALGTWFKKTFAAGPVAPTVIGWPVAGVEASFVFEVKNAGLATITWPASWHWAGDIVPAFSTDATDIVVAMSGDGGATVFAGVTLSGLNPGA